VKTGRANGSSLALLEDRVAIGEGRPQIYGSQLYQEGDGPLIVQAMEDPDHVDERRASIGLPPMAEYVNVGSQSPDERRRGTLEGRSDLTVPS
jgi:hypothetical protein